MIRTVTPGNDSCTTRLISASVAESILAVASSRIRTLCFLRRALASTTSCFCPADRLGEVSKLNSTAQRAPTYFSPALLISLSRFANMFACFGTLAPSISTAVAEELVMMESGG